MWKSQCIWVGIVLLTLVGVAGVFIKIEYQIKSTDLVVMFSSFSGALLAFIFSFILYGIKAESTKKSSIYKAKYLVDKISKFNTQILQYINEHKDESQNDSVDLKWFKIPRYWEFSPLPPIDLDSLIFLVDRNEKILDKIILVDKEYQSILRILEHRNYLYSLYLEKIEGFEQNNLRTLDTQGSLNLLELKTTQLIGIVGPKLFMELENLTEFLIRLTKNLEEDSKTALVEINKL